MRGWPGQLVVRVAKRQEASGQAPDRHPDALTQLIVTSRTPAPVAGPSHQSCPDRVLVHVGEFLLDLLDGEHVEVIESRLPDGPGQIEVPGVRGQLLR